MKTENITFEQRYKKAIDLLHKYVVVDENRKKPLTPHLLRVGEYLFDNGYSEDIVNAGLLHDALEWTDIPADTIKNEFGQHVYDIVLVNTKNRSIEDPVKRREDYVRRCAEVGVDALIVKAADALDSYNYYTKRGDSAEVGRSINIARLVLQKVKTDTDPIFKVLGDIVN